MLRGKKEKYSKRNPHNTKMREVKQKQRMHSERIHMFGQENYRNERIEFRTKGICVE